MASYIMLVQFTDQGSRNVNDSPKRIEAVKAAGAKLGVELKEVYWTLGAFDGVAVAEAPNDEAMTALALSVGKFGNVRTQTLRAFSADEFKGILGKVS